jgi:hypothetical protein
MKYLTKLKKAMPTKVQETYNGFIWHKLGGHAGTKSIEKSRAKFEALGFKGGPFASSQFNSPDGSVVGNDSVLFDEDGNKVEFIETYGVSPEYNRYSIHLTLK